MTETIGQRLLKIRRLEDLTQAQFAKSLGISQRAYAGYELGQRELPISVMINLREKFQIDQSWLMFGEGEPQSVGWSAVAEQATFIILEALAAENLQPPPEKVAKMVRHIFNVLTQVGEVSSSFARDYVNSAV